METDKKNREAALLISIKTALYKLRMYDKIISERDGLRSERDILKKEVEKAGAIASALFVPPGHFYSPIPSLEDVRQDESRSFPEPPADIESINLYPQQQLDLLEKLIPFYNELPFQPEKTNGLRYYYENPAYSYSDAILLHCMIRFLRPKRIIEVGSGFSSCMTLDTNELFFDGGIATTFIEPYPELLQSLIKESDKSKIKMIPSRIQDVPLSEFETLAANDILFIDSTHVSKLNSDVNYILFDVLPKLASGVYIHFHDIFYPFVYPKKWVYQGRSWNEAYILRAFLQYNDAFKIVLMNTYLSRFHKTFLQENLPLCMLRGASIWLRKE